MCGVAIVALMLELGAQGAAAAPGASAAADAWRIDVNGSVLREAWDFNGSEETLAGGVVGVDRRAWRGVSARGEVMAFRVLQDGEAAWLRGFTIGTRTRWGSRAWRPLVDVAVGLSSATVPVPPGGTRFNYLAVIGAGAERAAGPVVLSVTARWLHASNNGREGRHLNPDVQSLGLVVGVGWEH